MITFDVNQTEFPSERSKEIWYWGKHIIPLDISLAQITDADMREGCSQIYRVTRDIFADMYMHAEQFSSHNFDIVFNRFIKFGAFIDESGYNWMIPSAVYTKYIKRSGDLWTILQKFGFTSSEVGGSTVLSNEQYPLFLKYWYPLFSICQKRGINILSCDFRVFGTKYKLTIDDFLRTQADKDKAYFIELHEYAISKEAKLDTHFQYRKFRYIYKSECILIFEDLKMSPCVVVPYNNQYSKKRNPWISFDLFLATVDKQSDKDELARFIQKEICICNACSDRGCGHWLDIAGVRRMAASCHPEISKCLDSNESQDAVDYDMQMLKRMMDIRVLQTDNYDR